MAVQPIPEDYPQVIPYLTIDGAAAAIDLYTSVLGATERMRLPMPDGKIGHAELSIGKGMVMLADPNPDCGNVDPKQIGGSPLTVMVYVADVDATYARALAAGCTSNAEPTDQFYGDRSAAFTDPFGHKWHIATHVEDVEPAEMERRMKELFGG